MIRIALLLVGFALTACSPPVPDSGQGVGFGDYSDYRTYRAQREGELRGAPQPTTVRPPNDPIAPPNQNAVVNASPSNPPPAAVAATPVPARESASGPVAPNHPTISDEQDFSAVSNRQSIESDAERLRAQREAYQVIQPTAVPTRSSNSGPNIVKYALETKNPVGQKIYRRNNVFAQKKYEENCARFPSADLAQEAFLKAGGPQRDKLKIDPDGDGFACGWDPTPFRRIQASNG